MGAMTLARVLTVCTGNICRSPMAERLLRAGLTERFGDDAAQVEVTSAGTGALVGRPMAVHAAQQLRGLGGDGEGFEARAIQAELVAQADLVLAMTREHRSLVVRLHPGATRRTFTLRELARLVSMVAPDDLPESFADDGPADRLRTLLPAAAAKRGFAPVLDPADDDVVDPYGGRQELYATSAGQLAPAVRTILDAWAAGTHR